jgi:hypothetical protein
LIDPSTNRVTQWIDASIDHDLWSDFTRKFREKELFYSEFLEESLSSVFFDEKFHEFHLQQNDQNFEFVGIQKASSYNKSFEDHAKSFDKETSSKNSIQKLCQSSSLLINISTDSALPIHLFINSIRHPHSSLVNIMNFKNIPRGLNNKALTKRFYSIALPYLGGKWSIR